jgi:catechol 2,3-dioxygenase-like lactoylglutathione lyase family enzyme
MLASQIAYVALASRDPAATCALLQQHLKLQPAEFDSAVGPVPVYALGRSALAVFPLGHPGIDGDQSPGVHHVALAVDNVERGARHAAEVGVGSAPAEKGLGGRKSVALDRQAAAGVRLRLTESLGLRQQCDDVIERIDHLGVASSDVMEDERVFCRKFGFELESRQTDMEVLIAVESFTSDKYGVVYHNRPPQLEFLANFNPGDGTHIEHGRSGSTKQDQGAITRFVNSRGRGLHHIALKARDIDATLAAMAGAGLPMIDVKGRPGSRRAQIGFAHPHAMGGILMHLVQRDA